MNASVRPSFQIPPRKNLNRARYSPAGRGKADKDGNRVPLDIKPGTRFSSASIPDRKSSSMASST